MFTFEAFARNTLAEAVGRNSYTADDFEELLIQAAIKADRAYPDGELAAFGHVGMLTALMADAIQNIRAKENERTPA